VTGWRVSTGMRHIDLPGRTLLLVAGMPGAGKSTLLAGLPPTPGLTVLDSETYRDALGRLLPALPYAWYRPLVHLWHRLAVLLAALSDEPTLVVHLPATDERTRTAVARLARLTGRGCTPNRTRPAGASSPAAGSSRRPRSPRTPSRPRGPAPRCRPVGSRPGGPR
jgi:hypothetical protein